jgi:hypothetical protein
LPTISWTPACGVGYLTVQRHFSSTSGFEVEPQWTIRSDERGMGPSVGDGVRPRGSTEVVAPRQLVAGQSYSVVVAHSDESVLGSELFSP